MNLMQKKTDRYLEAEGRHFELTLPLLNLGYSDILAYRPG